MTRLRTILRLCILAAALAGRGCEHIAIDELELHRAVALSAVERLADRVWKP